VANALLAIYMDVNSVGSRGIGFGDSSLRVCLSLDIRLYAFTYFKRIARKLQ